MDKHGGGSLDTPLMGESSADYQSLDDGSAATGSATATGDVAVSVSPPATVGSSVRGEGLDGCKANAHEAGLNRWLDHSQARQYFKEARHPTPTKGPVPHGPGLGGTRDDKHVVGGHVPRSAGPAHDGPAHDYPAPGRKSVVHLAFDTDTREPMNTWTYRQWSCCHSTYTAVHETSLTAHDLITTVIDEEGNAVVNAVPFEEVDRVTVVADQPFVCEVLTKRTAIAFLNSAWGRYIVSQPTYIAVVLCLIVSCALHLGANAAVPKSVGDFEAAGVFLFLALALHAFLVVRSFYLDGAFACLARCCACCPATSHPCWVEYSEPREEGDPFPHAPNGTFIAPEPLEVSEVNRAGLDKARRGGGNVCCGTSRRSWVMLALLLVVGAAAAATSCWVALSWTSFQGSGGIPSSGECGVSASTRAWQDFACLPEYSPDNTKCWNKANGGAGGGGGGNSGSTSTGPPLEEGWGSTSTLAAPGPGPSPAGDGPTPPARRAQAASPTPTPNADLAFTCPGGSSAIDSVNSYARAKALSQDANSVGDTTCGMCKSAFLPSYRACAITTAVYLLSMMLAYVLGMAPRLPQEPWRMQDEGRAVLFVTTRYGTLGACAVVGDGRNAAQVARAIMMARRRIAAELLAGPGGAPPLVDVYGTNGRAPFWSCNTIGTGGGLLLWLRTKWALRWLDPANALVFVPAL